jgi:methylamine utilization protein MauE
VNLGGLATLSVVREVQVPILSVLLIGGCAAKARKALRARSVSAGLGPTAMFPLRLHRPVAIFMCASELCLGVALILTAGRAGAGTPATAVRAATALLFLTAVGALHELRTRRPDAGCGCFGDLSDTPVGLRAIARSALLSAAAVSSEGVPPIRMPTAPSTAVALIICGAAEIMIIAALSPELGEILVRLGYSEPCEIRRVPAEHTLSALRSSSAWRRYRRQLTSREPTDMWREGCWRFVVYPAVMQGNRADIVFAVYLHTRRPPVRVAAITTEPLDVALPPLTSTLPMPALSAPVPEGALTPPRGFRAASPVPAPPGPTAPEFIEPAARRRHVGFVRIIRPHSGTHQRRHSGVL